MKIEAIKTTLKEILFLRNLFLQESNFQIKYNALLERGRTEGDLISGNQHLLVLVLLKGMKILRKDIQLLSSISYPLSGF
jgi:hypothetical protein